MVRKVQLKRKGSKKRSQGRKMRFRHRARALSLGDLKSKAKQASSKLVSRMTPKELVLYKKIKQRYSEEVGNTPNRSFGDLSPTERDMALISQQAYQFVKNQNVQVDGFNLVAELSDSESVVFEKGDTVVIGYRGTVPSKMGDLVADYHITFGSTMESKRFMSAEKKYFAVKDTGRYSNIMVTGHSLGGAQAIHVAKLFDLECWAWNPGQGVSETYLNSQRIYPKIRTYHVLGDPISDTAGLENPASVFIFPAVSQINPLANHSLDNFLQ
jgi:hypothetical protein